MPGAGCPVVECPGVESPVDRVCLGQGVLW